MIIIPFPNWHSARLKSPKGFTKFRTKKITDGITIILGIRDGKSTVQSYRFDKKKFTAKQAREWLKKHGVKTVRFEKAVNEITINQFRELLMKETLM